MALSSFILCIIYAVYLIFGGLIFMSLEYERIPYSTVVEDHQWTRLKEIASNPYLNHPDKGEMRLHLKWVQSQCPNLTHSLVNIMVTAGNHMHDIKLVEKTCGNFTQVENFTTFRYPWSFIDAIYFSMTAITTIGYGHMAPSTIAGQVAVILYTLVGIPLTGTLLAWTSDFFGERLFILFRAMVDAENRKSKMMIGGVAVIYIMVGFVVFIFLPAVVFMAVEGWGYFRSVYFAYITLTTIGFGDYVTGTNMSGDWLYVYQISVILWIMSGLGYWLMIANFLTKALRSEKIQLFAKKAAALRKIISQLGPQTDTKNISKDPGDTLNFLIHLAKGIAIPPPGQKQQKEVETKPENTIKKQQLRGIAQLLATQENSETTLMRGLVNLGYLGSALDDKDNESTKKSDNVRRPSFISFVDGRPAVTSEKFTNSTTINTPSAKQKRKQIKTDTPTFHGRQLSSATSSVTDVTIEMESEASHDSSITRL